MTFVLFFTHTMSLEKWIEKGLFEREKLIYERYLHNSQVEKIYWLTYGSDDISLSKKLKKENKLHGNIYILQKPKIFIGKIGDLIYSFLAPIVHRKVLQNVDFYKTNQMNGSWTAVIAKKLFRKKLQFRTGYTQSIFTAKLSDSLIRNKLHQFLENFAYNNCDIATVASEADKQHVVNNYDLNSNKVTVVHNYIDIDKFNDFNELRKKDFIYVGRFSEQKNLFNFLNAFSKTNYSLDMYGKGELEGNLKKLVKNKNISVNFKGIVENSALPQILNEYKYYILPSYYEGMPKTLLEAMACGCCCIGTDVEGINEVIKHNENGILIPDTSEKDIIKTLNSLDNYNYAQLAKNGVKTIKEDFSLDSIQELEYSLIQRNIFK